MKFKKEKSQVNKDIEQVKEAYGLPRYTTSFEQIFENHVIENEHGRRIFKNELYKFVNEHFDEINEDFTLRVNDFGNEIPFDEGALFNLHSTMFSLNKECDDVQESDGISFFVDLPCESCLITNLFYSISKFWSKYNKEKIVKLYFKVNEYCIDEIPLNDEIRYE